MRTLAFISFGAAIALTPPAALAQSVSSPPSATHYSSAHKPTSSFRSEMRKRHTSSKDRARAGAEHVRTMRQQ